MKILHVLDYIQPKLGYQETFLVKEQMKAGHEVRVITSDRYFPYPNYQQSVYPILGSRYLKPGKHEEEGIEIVRLPAYFEIFTRVCLKGMEKTVAEFKPDVVHGHFTASLTCVRLARLKKKLKYRLVLDDHMHYSIIQQNHWLKVIFYWLFRLLFSKTLLKNVDHFTAITDETRRLMDEYYGIPKEKIEVVELGADTDRFTFRSEERFRLRKGWGLGPEDIVMTYTGKIITDKGPHILLSAAIPLMKNNAHLQLLFVGNGKKEYIEEMKSKIAENKLQDQVIWQEMVQNKDLPAYYSASDIGVWPLQESLSVIEAASCKLPVIAKDSDVTAKRISNNNGLSYKEGESDDLRKKLEILINDPQMRKEMGERGRDLVEREFSWKVISERFVELYGG